MACENEADQRNRKRRTIQAQINEKRAELDRHAFSVNVLTPMPLTSCSPHLVDTSLNVNPWRELKRSKTYSWNDSTTLEILK